MVIIRLMEEKDIESVLVWSDNTEEFLKQWSNYTYPLNRKQILDRINSNDYKVFSIEFENKLVGTIQLLKFDSINNSAKIGCYLINSTYRGKGIGTEALRKLLEYAFNEHKLQKVVLGVFDYNIGAIKCYEKVGFRKKSEYNHPMGWVGYTMVIDRDNYNLN